MIIIQARIVLIPRYGIKIGDDDMGPHLARYGTIMRDQDREENMLLTQ
jgi:hypothetical protein